VGSASMIKNLSNELVKTGEKDEKGKDIKDTNMMAMFESHVSNLAGYLLFGDPPFIAICEKYGFAEGMLWQIKNMWPLALYSLFSSTYKLNLCLIEREGLQRPEAWAKAFENTVSGIKNNIPVLVNILIGSFANAWRYFMGVDLSEQDIRGIRFQIGEILSKKIGNLATLPYSEEFGKTADEKEQDMLGYLSEIGAEWDLFQGLQQELDRLEKDEKSENASEKSFRDRLNRAIFEKRYDEVIRLGQENGIPLIELFVMNLKDFEKARQKGYNFSQDGVEMPRDWKLFFHNFQFYKVYDRATDVERIKHAVGHNMGDVIDVFPFQAGCVPFLTTAFKDVVWGLEKAGLPKTMQEVMMFFMIMGFSMVADNYVACKVGLELFPDNPQIPLIAAIQGGSMTAIGNMANIAQFSLDDFPLAKSWAMKNWHMDNIAIGLAWSQAIKALKNLGIGYFESPEVKNSSDNHAKSETGSLLKFTQTDGSEKITRRDFLHGNKKKAA